MFENLKKIPDPLINFIRALLTKIDTTEDLDPPRFWMWIYIASFILPLIFAAGLMWLLPQVGLLVEINAESAKSTLSTIIQSQVSIIAIVIAISLVAIELSITKYGKEVFEIFKQHPAMWLLLVSYTLSIILNTTLLLSIFQTGNETITAEIKVFSLYYSTFLFFMLVIVLLPHFRATMNQLHTDKVFLGLIDHVKISDLKPHDDPFQAIFLIVYSAIEKNDFQTMSILISASQRKYIEIINAGSPALNKQFISFRFFDDLKRVTITLLGKTERRFVFEIFTVIRGICDNSLEKREILSYAYAINFVGDIGANAVKWEYQQTANDSFSLLVEYYEKTKGISNFKTFLSVFSQSFSNIGEEAILKNNFGLGGTIILQFKTIILDNIDSNEYVPVNAIMLYGQLINKCVKQGNQQFYDEAIPFLEQINAIATERNLDKIVFMSKHELEEIKAVREYYTRTPPPGVEIQ